MNLDLIERLVDRLERGTASELEFESPEGVLRLRRRGTPVGSSAADPCASAHDPAIRLRESAPRATIDSPALGVFTLRHPLASVVPELPMKVVRGERVGFLRIGALVSAVRAPHDGVVVRSLVDEDQPVGFGTPLLEFTPLPDRKDDR